MKLQVDRGNYQGLKVLICASLKGKTIELNVINLTGEFSLSPSATWSFFPLQYIILNTNNNTLLIFYV